MTNLATYDLSEDVRNRLSDEWLNHKTKGVVPSLSTEPKVKYDAALGTVIGFASLVSFAPSNIPAFTDNFSLSGRDITPTVISNIDESYGFKFETPIAKERGRVDGSAVYVEFLEDFDSAEIEAMHLEASRSYGW